MRLSDSQLEAALRAMAEAIGSGIGVATYLENEAASAILPSELREILRRSLKSGGSLTTGFRLSGVVGESELALLRAGEKRGNVDETLLAMADAVEQRRRDRMNLIKGLAYPAFLLAASGCVLPLPKIITEGVWAYLSLAIWTPLVVALATVYALVVAPRLKPGSPMRTLPRRFGMALPLLGPALQRGTHATFLNVLGKALAAGMALPLALRAAIMASDNPRLIAREDVMMGALEGGATLGDILVAAGQFHPTVLSAVAQGELTGKLDEILPRAAARERAVQRRAVTILLFIAIGIVALAVLTVIVINLIQSVTGYFDFIDSQIDAQGGHLSL